VYVDIARRLTVPIDVLTCWSKIDQEAKESNFIDGNKHRPCPFCTRNGHTVSELISARRFFLTTGSRDVSVRHGA
jgi:hypothetical protein